MEKYEAKNEALVQRLKKPKGFDARTLANVLKHLVKLLALIKTTEASLVKMIAERSTLFSTEKSSM